MKIDAHGVIGRFGVVSKGIADRRTFIDTLDRRGIDRCVACSTMALLHDGARGNEEARRWAAESDGRLIPVPVVNPRWPLDEAEDQWEKGASALMLAPSFHRFRLNDRWLFEPLENWLVEKKVPLFIHSGFACASDFYSPAGFAELADFCDRHSNFPIVILGLSYVETEGVLRFLRHHPNVFLETSYLYGARYIETLVENGLEDQIVAGTGFGVNSLDAGWSVVNHAEIPSEKKAKIGGGNLVKILVLEE